MGKPGKGPAQEAKDNPHRMSAGMDQALEHGELLDVPFIYTSNGDGFMEHDRTVTKGSVEQAIAAGQQ